MGRRPDATVDATPGRSARHAAREPQRRPGETTGWPSRLPARSVCADPLDDFWCRRRESNPHAREERGILRPPDDLSPPFPIVPHRPETTKIRRFSELPALPADRSHPWRAMGPCKHGVSSLRAAAGRRLSPGVYPEDSPMGPPDALSVAGRRRPGLWRSTPGQGQLSPGNRPHPGQSWSPTAAAQEHEAPGGTSGGFGNRLRCWSLLVVVAGVPSEHRDAVRADPAGPREAEESAPAVVHGIATREPSPALALAPFPRQDVAAACPIASAHGGVRAVPVASRPDALDGSADTARLDQGAEQPLLVGPLEQEARGIRAHGDLRRIQRDGPKDLTFDPDRAGAQLLQGLGDRLAEARYS